LFPPRSRLVTVVESRVRIDCEVADAGSSAGGAGDGDGGVAKNALTDRQLALLAAHVECLVSVVNATRSRRTAFYGPSVSDAVARRDESRAVWLIKERLYWQQPRAAAALLVAFRVLLPSRFWFADDATVLRKYTSELALQGGTRRLVLRRPPSDDDRGLAHMSDVLTAMHTEFFRRYDKQQEQQEASDNSSGAPDVADVLADLKPRFTDYPMWALAGTKLSFSGLIKKGSDPRKSEVWVRSAF
jgi:hypothetical protein